MDQKDKNILNLLRKNSRYSIREMASELGMRPSTVHVRMTKLQKDGIIEQFTIKTNDKAVDESFLVLLSIKGDIHKENALLEEPCVKEVFHITGEYNTHMKLKFGNVESFNTYITKLRTSCPQLQIVSSVATQKVKEEL